MYLTYFPASGRTTCKACGKKIEKGCLQMNISHGMGAWSVSGNFHAMHSDCEEIKKAFIDGCNKLLDERLANAKKVV